MEFRRGGERLIWRLDVTPHHPMLPFYHLSPCADFGVISLLAWGDDSSSIQQPVYFSCCFVF